MDINKYSLICVSFSKGLQHYTASLYNELCGYENVDLELVAQKETIDQVAINKNSIVLEPSSKSITNLIKLLKVILSKHEGNHVIHYQGNNIAVLCVFKLMSLFKLIDKKTTVLTPHNVKTHWKRPLYDFFKFSLWNSFDKIILHTKSEKKYIPENISQKVTVIPHGEYFTQMTTKSIGCDLSEEYIKLKQYIDTERLKGNKSLLFVGYIRDDKNLQILLKYRELLNNNNIKLIVAGENKSSLNDSHIEKNSDISYLSSLNEKELIDVIKSSDVVALPYDKVSESGILHLSLSLGTPLITTDLDEFRERIKLNENATIFQGFEFKEFENSIKRLHALFNKVDKKEISNNHIEEYSWESIASRTLTMTLGDELEKINNNYR